ncbi:ATP-binding protein [Kineococcus esterisolvens]|uniref:ATP-binding protein n=1 Tax=unclassified Kineococcus TaxID=2621656 RepID=UPI003D7F0B88
MTERGGDDTSVVVVRLLGLPLRSRALLSRHLEGLLRELALLRIGEEQGRAGSLPRRLLELAAELQTTYAPYRAQRAQAMDDALAAGQEFFDAVYTTTTRSAEYVQRLFDGLEEADDFCRADRHLLTLPAPEELVALRRWMFGEILRQLAGGTARPWHGPVRRDEPADYPAPVRASDTVTATAPAPGGTDGRLLGEPLVLDSAASAVSAARRHVRGVLRDLGAEALEEAAELGVSELVTNALLHARTTFTVAVRALPDGRLRVEVTDSSPVPVQVRRFGAAATTGRGLQLLEALSSDWGVDLPPADPGADPGAVERGKTVWFVPREAVPGDGLPPGDWDAEVAALLQDGGT